MKYLDEYRNGDAAKRLADAIAREASRHHVVMEICGGQTHSIVRYGLDEMLPETVELVHGPGCPVCVTPLEAIDRAHAIARRDDVVFCSFGDMLRVPGSETDLLRLKSEGADVRIVYSPLDALRVAQENPAREVVFFAIGFETTAPPNAMAVSLAARRGIRNFSVLVSHVLVPPAIDAILSAPDNRVRGFLGPGHVCTVTGLSEYEPLASGHRTPIVVSGFEPVDLLEGVLRVVRQLERGQGTVENQYGRSVRPAGNEAAQALVTDVFEVRDQKWRGIGAIPRSGLGLREKYTAQDAERKFDVGALRTNEPAECISGEILRGVKKPWDCAAFGKRCTPERPLGATMVSSEGACAAYFAYGRTEKRRRLPLAEAPA
ncbi:MAG TPA: hydrogenase formation protein HypD [Polyangiaceae bacterium]|nr:hydrogenase formation protein HypD [Polyangiaceae bacterium]